MEGLTILVHLINHLLQLLGCGVLAQHPHHLAQLLGADTAILRAQDKDIKGGLELCVQRQGEEIGSAARTLEIQSQGRQQTANFPPRVL